MKATKLMIVALGSLALSAARAADEPVNERTLATDKLIPSPGNTTYFVDPAKGDDANPAGKSWKSFSKINSMKLAPGDKVVVSPGRQEETLSLSGEGTSEKPIVIQFLPGVHTLGSQNTLRMPMFVSNSQDSTDPKPVGVLVQHCKHLRFEGGGVKGPDKTTILYDGRMVQIFNDHSEGITFAGLVFDLKRPTVSEFRVLGTGPTHAVIQIAEGSDYAIENGKFAWKGDWGPGAFCQEGIPDAGRCWRAATPRGWDANGQSVAGTSELGGRKVRLDFPGVVSGLAVGHQYQLRATRREFVGVHNARSKDIVFRDCDVYSLTGMGFVSQFTENITFQRVNVAPPGDTLRTCAAWADIFHFSNCRGKILIDSCRLSGMQDDPINCHGTHLRLIEKAGDNRVRVRFMHAQTYGFAAYSPGDEVAVINHANLRELPDNPRRKVMSVERKSDKDWVIALDGPVPSFGKDDVLDNITWYPDITVRNVHVSMDPTRGFLLTTRGKVLVENNTLHRPGMDGILIENDAEGWFESGPVRDMVIRNNRFIGCGISVNPHTEGDKPGEAVHENIRIEDNFFDGGGVSARSVKGLTVMNNRSAGKNLAVSTQACSAVKVENNKEEK